MSIPFQNDLTSARRTNELRSPGYSTFANAIRNETDLHTTILFFFAAYLFLLFCIEWFGFISADENFTTSVNIFGPIALIVGCLGTVLFSLRISRLTILLPFTWSLVATSMYFGQGPLTYFIGNEASVGYSQSHFYVSPSTLASTNLLNTSFLGVSVIAYLVFKRLRVIRLGKYRLHGISNEVLAARWLAAICLFVGLSVRSGLPAFFAGENVIGMIGTLDALVEMSVAPLAYLYVKGNRLDRFAFWVCLFFCVASSFFMFQKTGMMRSYILALVGLGLAKSDKRNMLMIIVMAVVSFAATANAVGNLRDFHNREFRHQKHSFSSHLATIEELWDSGDLFNSSNETQGWLLRTNYVPIQAFAMDQYDRGFPGDSYKHAFWIFVPRILYADKPNMTDIGNEFSILFNGNESSSVSIGIAGEAYHNGGPFFVFLTGILIGFFYYATETILVMLEGSLWTYFPCLVLMLSMGLRVDGHLVPDFLGTSVLILGYIWVTSTLIISFPSLSAKGGV